MLLSDSHVCHCHPCHPQIPARDTDSLKWQRLADSDLKWSFSCQLLRLLRTWSKAALWDESRISTKVSLPVTLITMIKWVAGFFFSPVWTGNITSPTCPVVPRSRRNGKSRDLHPAHPCFLGMSSQKAFKLCGVFLVCGFRFGLLFSFLCLFLFYKTKSSLN